MTKAEEAKAWALAHVGCPYIYGGTGQICTPSYRQARMQQYPSYQVKIARNCPRLMGQTDFCSDCKWSDPDTGNGKRAYDCAQLVRRCMEHIGISMVSGANSQWEKTNWEQAGEIGTIPRGKLCIVYRYDADKGRMGHTGIYLGDGYIVHAKGHDYGVVKELLGNPTFTHWGIPAGLYSEVDISMTTLHKGDSGPSVSELQRILVDKGYDLDVDGKFGAQTYAAVRTFQAKAGLKVDGIVGPNTWAALGVSQKPQTDEPAKDEPAPDAPLGNDYFVLSMADALRLREAVETINGILALANWGEDDG